MKQLFQLYRKVNLLSIDVACGAVVCAMFFAKLLNVVIGPYGLACLGLTVWIIYTSDHLFDVWSLKYPASTDRHQFHQKHFTLLTILLLLAAAVDLILSFFINTLVFQWGLGLTAVVSLYFLIQSQLKSFKELVGALLYSAGILLPSLPLAEHPITSFPIYLIGQFVITVLINLILFSWFDHSLDLQDHRSSLVTVLGNRCGKILLSGLFMVQGFLSGYLIVYSNYSMAAAVLVMMNLVLFIIFAGEGYFSVQARYRYAGDAIFFFPWIYVLMG
jgi:hypothetical protein